jgi:hypothetical protein
MSGEFAFRMRVYAAAHFEFLDVLQVRWPDAVAFFQSEYTGGADGRAYPVTIHGEIRGPGESLQEAEPRLASTIGNVLPLISLCANAAIADPLAISAHGLDLQHPQPFTGYRTPGPEDWFPPGKGLIDLEPTLALITAVGQHPQTDLLQRAIESYRRAAGHWFPEQHLLAGEFLFIAAETLSRFLIESRAAAQGITPKNLVKLSGFQDESKLRNSYLKDEVFGGDQEAFDGLHAASNGFEHGYMTLDGVRGLMAPVLERSFGYIRRALISATGVDDESARRLLAERYAETRALVPAIFYVQGELSREDPALPPPVMGGAPIELEWKISGPDAVTQPDGEVNITFVPNVTCTTLPDNTQLGISVSGIRAANIKPSPEPVLVEVTRAGAADDAGGELLVRYSYEPTSSGAVSSGVRVARDRAHADAIVRRLKASPLKLVSVEISPKT